MNFASLQTALQALGLSADQDSTFAVAAGGTLTLHVAHNGAGLSITRIETLTLSGDLVVARTQKKETFVVPTAAIFTVGMEAPAGKEGRRQAGFG